ncbi:hypothetical protein SDRG_06642 [Saprolegnia diclina VS20]|uniref:PDZ domain-containing protein n=1 Tax=Saprolegnia diclina (strain VS20) TaxID=1156394 RepID=T0QDD2_SAPDV|nr:hypothetical protein SDRG_06642 [Saprolegnia diclina VS20]EQC35894.1 hypothetical protein SDRG_06642 [Saprolegnia diclina VS20]|eukprot:XP_008610656.1 hypothetical protein SDRG_06642 [Saprolegnia diclina VS20]
MATTSDFFMQGPESATSPTKKLLAHPSAVARHLQRRRSTAANAPIFNAPTTSFHRSDAPMRHSIGLDGRYPEPMADRAPYDIVWDNAFLGLVFRCNSKNQCIIRRVDANAPPEVVHVAHVGDALIAYNNQPNLNFDMLMERLRNPRFPVTLSFAPPSQALPVSRPPQHGRHSLELPRPLHIEIPRGTPSIIQSDVSGSIISSEDNDAMYATFEVVWNEGTRLGVSIIKVGALPSVKERVERPADPSLAQIQAGDQLVAIQGVNTLDIGYQASIVLLRDTRKPVRLLFRRLVTSSCRPDMNDSVLSQPGPPPRETEYSLVWESGPLGLTLKKDKLKNELIVTKLQDEGLAARSKLLSIGDILISISNVQVVDLGLRGTMAYLKAVPKPAVLVFHRVAGTDPDASVSSRTSISSRTSVSSRISSEPPPPAYGLPVSPPAYIPPAVVSKPMSPPPAYAAIMHQRSSQVVESMAKLELTPTESSETTDQPQPLSFAPKSYRAPVVLAPVSGRSTYSDLDDSGLVMGVDMPPISTLPGPGTVNVVWSGGPLGLTLKATGARVTISRVTGKGEAGGLDMLRAGDILSAINEVEDLTLESATIMLKTLEKPIFLRFTLQQVEEEL